MNIGMLYTVGKLFLNGNPKNLTETQFLSLVFRRETQILYVISSPGLCKLMGINTVLDINLKGEKSEDIFNLHVWHHLDKD